jgi:hypothetical protein
VSVHHHVDRAIVRRGNADDQLMVDSGRAVEITVEPKRAELTIAGDVGDAPRGPVASCLKMAQQRVLGQMLLEQLLGIGEVKYPCGLDLPGTATGPTRWLYEYDSAATRPDTRRITRPGKSPPPGRYNSASPLLSWCSNRPSSAMIPSPPPDQVKQNCRYHNSPQVAQSDWCLLAAPETRGTGVPELPAGLAGHCGGLDGTGNSTLDRATAGRPPMPPSPVM